MDNTGTASHRADVRVAGDAIAEVGDGLAPRCGERIIDAGSNVVAAGVIDMPSHADRGIEVQT